MYWWDQSHPGFLGDPLPGWLLLGLIFGFIALNIIEDFAKAIDRIEAALQPIASSLQTIERRLPPEIAADGATEENEA